MPSGPRAPASVQDWSFLDRNGERLSRVPTRALSILQDTLRYYYLTALRDAASHFSARGRFWRPFLKDSQLAPDRKAEIEDRLQEVNDLVVSSHASFERVRTGLRRVQSVVPLASGEAVSIEAVPGRMFDMLARAQIQLGTTTGAKVPLVRHGEGTQSLAVLMLFSAFLEVAEGIRADAPGSATAGTERERVGSRADVHQQGCHGDARARR